MKVLIDIGHPGHVHLFKHFAHEMLAKGHQVLFTVRDKEFEQDLLQAENLPFVNIGKHYSNKLGKVWGLLKFTALIIKASLKFKPDIYLSHGSIYTAFASFFMRKPNIALEDSGNWEQVRLYLPFTEAVLTSTSFTTTYGAKQIYYSGYHELAYLHPRRFTPNAEIYQDLGLATGEPFFILRFVSWKASHDIGQKGLSLDQKRKLIEMLSLHGNVFISAEKGLQDEFAAYKFPLGPDKMHDALALASMFVGEGATMASEAGVLGTTAVYINTIERDYLKDQEKYGLVYNFYTPDGVLEKVEELLNDGNLVQKAKEACTKLLADKIDVSAFLVWFMENHPESIAIMKQNPDYQKQFS